jgi:hypothetical protein
MATALKPSAPKPLPVPNGDFYEIVATLSDRDRAILTKVRDFMDRRAA